MQDYMRRYTLSIRKINSNSFNYPDGRFMLHVSGSLRFKNYYPAVSTDYECIKAFCNKLQSMNSLNYSVFMMMYFNDICILPEFYADKFREENYYG